jgi:hypothetical protein
MIRLEDLGLPVNITSAFPCTINRGIIDDLGNRIDLPARIYIDDAIMLAVSVDHMKMVLAAMMEAIFCCHG